MVKPAKGEIATRHLRMLLVKQGLTEDEADAFIQHLPKEFRSGCLYSEASLRVSVDAYLARLAAKRSIPDRLKEALWTLLIGAAGSALWDLLKAEIESQIGTNGPTIPSEHGIEVPQKWNGEILIEWGLQSPSPQPTGEEQCLRRSLELREHRYGRFHQKVAVSLDALGFCLDVKGEHKQSAGYRATALKVSERVSGPKSANTAAALSNLGLCLARQRQYADAEKLVRRSYDVFRRACGPRHIWTAAAVFNLFYVMKAQGSFLLAGYPQQIRAMEPNLQKAFADMMIWKRVNITLDAVKELAEHLKVWAEQIGK